MTAEPVRVSRRIPASAAAIFAVLADPRTHLALDGSGMVRGAVTDAPVTAVGDVFVMQMYFVHLGDYQMNNHVVEHELNRRIVWEPEAGLGHPDAGAADARWGHRWGYELVPDGPDATIVTEIYDISRAAQEAQATVAGGTAWIETIERTLERLERVCTGREV